MAGQRSYIRRKHPESRASQWVMWTWMILWKCYENGFMLVQRLTLLRLSRKLQGLHPRLGPSWVEFLRSSHYQCGFFLGAPVSPSTQKVYSSFMSSQCPSSRHWLKNWILSLGVVQQLHSAPQEWVQCTGQSSPCKLCIDGLWEHLKNAFFLLESELVFLQNAIC